MIKIILSCNSNVIFFEISAAKHYADCFCEVAFGNIQQLLIQRLVVDMVKLVYGLTLVKMI